MEICPVCKQAQLTLYLGGYIGKVYRCSNCGYVGPVVIEMTAEEYARMMRELGEG